MMNHLVLIFILLLNLTACSVQTPIFDYEPARSVIVVETAKMKLSFSGDNDETKELVLLMQKDPLNDFNATKENYVRIHSENSKADKIDVTMSESRNEDIKRNTNDTTLSD